MKTSWISFAAMGVMVFFLAGSALAQPACTLELEALAGSTPGSTVQGFAHFCADDSGIQVELVANNLNVGDAYTAWFVYFDQPSTCKTQPCTGADLAGDDPAGIIARLDGTVAKNGGWAFFGGKIKDLKLSSKSQVWVAIFGHGPAVTGDNKKLGRQLLTPQAPALGAPGLGTAGDGALGGGRAIAVFQIP
jgi:hypothetical protein